MRRWRNTQDREDAKGGEKTVSTTSSSVADWHLISRVVVDHARILNLTPSWFSVKYVAVVFPMPSGGLLTALDASLLVWELE